jgi:hypothetical protein
VASVCDSVCKVYGIAVQPGRYAGPACLEHNPTLGVKEAAGTRHRAQQQQEQGACTRIRKSGK